VEAQDKIVIVCEEMAYSRFCYTKVKFYV